MSTFEKKKKQKTHRNVDKSPVDQKGKDSAPGVRKDRKPKTLGNNDSNGEARDVDSIANHGAKKLSPKERRALAEATLREAQGSSATDSAERDHVSDPQSRMLLDQGVVTSAQMAAALQTGSDSENLWRMVVDVDGVDAEAVYGAIARKAGIREFQYLDAAPSREFIDDLIPSIGIDALISLLDRDLLPVELEPGMGTEPLLLTIASHDPTHPTTRNFVGDSPFTIDCRYAVESALSERLDTVRGWITDRSRYGTSPAGRHPTASSSEESTPDPGSEEVIDLGSYGVDGGLVAEPVKPDVDAPAPAPTTSPAAADAPPARPQESTHSDAPESPSSDDSSTDSISPEHNSGSGTSSGSRPKPPSVNDRVLDWLLKQEVVTLEQVRSAQAKTNDRPGKDATWRFLAEMVGVSKEDVFREVADLYAFKHAVIKEGSPDHDFVLLTMETIAETRREALIDAMLIPFEHALDMDTGSGRMIFVTHDPTRPDINILLHQLDLGRFEIRYAPESAIHDLLIELFPRRNEYLEKMSDDDSAFDLGTSHDAGASTLIDEDALEAEMSRSNLINLFEAALVEAVRMNASDIHIFPNANRQVEIHFRRDGRLKLWHTEDSVHPEAFLAVVKDNSSGVDRFERDTAQDGFIQRTIDDTLIRFRVSILPVASANSLIRAESIVIRVLDDRKVLTDLSALGMLDVAKERFDMAIHQPHGMVILTGPTGSGKSTTLVASLYQVITPEVNVLTVEDPVEYIIRGVRQIKLSHKLNLDSALRSILRHDPDIVMVGEMRDQHTAELAIKLANTGHLTFSTLHTNDAPAAISRLFKMGIEPFLIAYAINLVVAQRLIRTVCPDCRQKDENPDRVLMKSMGWTDAEIDDMTIFKSNRGSGCKTCGSVGYKGRRALCETLYFSPKIRHMIAASEEMVNEDDIREVAVEEGMLTLRDSAKVLVAMGETTVDEMLRVTGTS